jgi:hypothetical protein
MTLGPGFSYREEIANLGRAPRSSVHEHGWCVLDISDLFLTDERSPVSSEAETAEIDPSRPTLAPASAASVEWTPGPVS